MIPTKKQLEEHIRVARSWADRNPDAMTTEEWIVVAMADYIDALRAVGDCKQDTVCATPPGCARHWEERNRELVQELQAARACSNAFEADVDELKNLNHFCLCRAKDAETELLALRAVADAAVAYLVEPDGNQDALSDALQAAGR
jgi:hypothetical protein